jgi:hypothetical protein
MTLVIDCHDLDALGGFWAAAVEYEVLPEWTPSYRSLRPLGDPKGRPGILLQRVPEAKTLKNRLHLDLHASDGPAEIARLEGLGASTVGEVSTEFLEEHGTRFQVMADPEGNEFCVVWREAEVPWDG